jgi:hypothetical protein
MKELAGWAELKSSEVSPQTVRRLEILLYFQIHFQISKQNEFKSNSNFERFLFTQINIKAHIITQEILQWHEMQQTII